MNSHQNNHALQNGYAKHSTFNHHQVAAGGDRNHVYTNSTSSTPERQRKTYMGDGHVRPQVCGARAMCQIYYTLIFQNNAYFCRSFMQSNKMTTSQSCRCGPYPTKVAALVSFTLFSSFFILFGSVNYSLYVMFVPWFSET